jgi:polyisoprenoid-binding protein YceI
MKRFMSFFILAMVIGFHANAQITWQIDPAHSNVDFSVRYMMLSHVRGTYSDVDATLVQENDGFAGSQVTVAIDAASINTQNNDRDAHLRSDDFFDVENHPEIEFVSREFRKTGENTYKITGDLTIRGTSNPVELDAELIGKIDDPRGFKRAAFTATTSVNRNDFGVQWNQALEAGGFVVGRNVDITINAQFIAQEG